MWKMDKPGVGAKPELLRPSGEIIYQWPQQWGTQQARLTRAWLGIDLHLTSTSISTLKERPVNSASL